MTNNIAHDDVPLACRSLAMQFSEGRATLKVLRSVDLEVASGERLAIVGASGSGKTTLLQLLGGLDTPSGGVVEVFGQNLATIGDAERGRIRNRALGFVYQFHHLLPEFD
ncbi:MAG TPA: ATP-binding cassette domain-containing protein, partial [Chromatiales bacterium]|nr:ATP-binding cassette domain-containing protein [Chromatiales bacterium]